jgi:hypothetical protein
VKATSSYSCKNSNPQGHMVTEFGHTYLFYYLSPYSAVYHRSVGEWRCLHVHKGPHPCTDYEELIYEANLRKDRFE